MGLCEACRAEENRLLDESQSWARAPVHPVFHSKEHIDDRKRSGGRPGALVIETVRKQRALIAKSCKENHQ